MIDNKNKVYAFTNENVSSFEKIYNFNGAKVLSVIGSGDQYFASLLYGAKEIVLYDSNPNAWLYFVFKFYALKTLSYEDFFTLAIWNEYEDTKIVEKLMSYIPIDIAKKLKDFIKVHGSLKSFILYSSLSNLLINYKSDRIIPYFDKERYYKLQRMLRNTTLPRVYITNLLDIKNILDKEHFDIVLTSNIFDWLSISPEEYSNLLNKFPADIIQAHYIWSSQNIYIEEFSNLGFDIDAIPSVTGQYSDTSREENIVISKR